MIDDIYSSHLDLDLKEKGPVQVVPSFKMQKPKEKRSQVVTSGLTTFLVLMKAKNKSQPG